MNINMQSLELKDMVLGCLKDNLKMHPLKVHNIYLYGSRVYGTATDNSDYDFIVVANNNVENIEHSFVYNNIDINLHIQTPDYFKSRMDWNELKSFECVLYSKINPILEKKEFEINLAPKKFRHSVAQHSSTSFVKGQKKIQNGETYIGQKSLYHSLRMPMFASQIMKSGDIYDWTCANEYWDDIKNETDWDVLKDKYQPIRNEIMTKFRELCPKD